MLSKFYLYRVLYRNPIVALSKKIGRVMTVAIIFSKFVHIFKSHKVYQQRQICIMYKVTKKVMTKYHYYSHIRGINGIKNK